MPRYFIVSFTAVAALVLTAGPARAQPSSVEAPSSAEAPPKAEAPKADAAKPKAADVEAPPRNYVNLGIGVSSATHGVLICAEVAPLSMLSISACGNGSSFLYEQATPETVHFDVHVALTSWKLSDVWLEPRLHAGIAELQIGEDAPGLDFSGTSSTGMATAGPEAGASVRGLLPVYKGMEIVGELSLALSYFHYAPELVRPQSAWQPSVTFTVGAGF
jgi:hypothetical protein